MAKLILQKVLDRKRITQYGLAKRLKITPGEVFRWCQEDYNPTLQTLLRIADALEVGLDELVQRRR